MQKRIGILYFSPTGTTKRICQSISLGIGVENPNIIDVTYPDTRTDVISNPEKYLNNTDHLIVGAPVYVGKLPIQVIECLKAIDGKGKNCTSVVVYGNRDYGIALRSMVKLLSGNGFNVIAAGAFIGQHSYKDIIPVAMGRPDSLDLDLAIKFGEKISGATKPLEINSIPVQLDMFSRSKSYFPLKPVYYENECNHCGDCAKTCPTGIISADTGGYINKKATEDCIGCMACVNSCEYNARINDANLIMKLFIKRVLKKASQMRTEPLTVFA